MICRSAHTALSLLALIFSHQLFAQFSDNALLFSGNANKELAEKVAAYLQTPLGHAKISTFNDGEINIQIEESVRNKDIFIIQSTCKSKDTLIGNRSVNDNLMELFLLVRTMKRSSASSITVVMPYYGYARQDRKSAPRVPISAADIATLLEVAGVDRVLTVDLHCGQIQGFFYNVPVDNLYAAAIFIPHIMEYNLKNVVVVAPDAGGVDRANKFSNHLNQVDIPTRIALISKQRAGAGIINTMDLIGDVTDADAIIVDDMCDTAGTLVKAAQLLHDNGARRVFAVITHPVFSGNALEKIRSSVLDAIFVADTIPLADNAPDTIHCVSVSTLLGQAIMHIQQGKSVSELFQ